MLIVNLVGRLVKVASRRVLSVAVLAPALGSFALGCTELKDGSQRRAVELPSEWACLTDPPDPPQFPQRPTFTAYDAPIVDFANPPSPVPGLKVQVCPITDPECTRPAGFAAGPFKVPVPGAPIEADGYRIVVLYDTKVVVRLSAPGYLTQEYFFGGPLVGMPSAPGSPPESVEIAGDALGLPGTYTAALVRGLYFTLVSEKRADSLAEQIGQKRDPNRAIIGVRTIDCNGNPAPGVTLSLEGVEESLPFTYRSDNALGAVDKPRPTDSQGLAGFANILLPNQVDIYNVSLKGIAPTGDEFGELTLSIRPNQMTSAEIRPWSEIWGR